MPDPTITQEAFAPSDVGVRYLQPSPPVNWLEALGRHATETGQARGFWRRRRARRQTSDFARIVIAIEACNHVRQEFNHDH